MKTKLFIRLSKSGNGEIAGYITSTSPDSIVVKPDMVELDYDTYKFALSPKMPEQYAYTGAGLELLPERPSREHVFDWLNKTWFDPRTVTDLKTLKTAEINAAREQADNGVFTFKERDIACDLVSRSRIDSLNGYVSLYADMPEDWLGGWKAVDNSYVTVDSVAEWKSLYRAMYDQGRANFAHAQELKERLEKAQTLADVSAVAW